MQKALQVPSMYESLTVTTIEAICVPSIVRRVFDSNSSVETADSPMPGRIAQHPTHSVMLIIVLKLKFYSHVRESISILPFAPFISGCAAQAILKHYIYSTT